jgi:hypothetical protein
MKSKIISVAMLLIAGSASAHWHGHGGCCYRPYNGGDWIAPAIIGGVIGYELSRPNVIVQPPVIVQQPQVINDPNLIIVNGILYRKEYIMINGVMQEVLVKQ